MAKNLYEILGLDKNATQEELRAAYKKRAIQTHPDKGGNNNEFQEIAMSYGILSDHSKRERYDRTGEVEEERFEKKLLPFLNSMILGLVSQMSPEYDNLVILLTDNISNIKKGILGELVTINKDISNNEKVLSRIIKRSDGINHFEFILNSKISELKDKVFQMGDDIKFMDKVLDYLKNYEYNSDIFNDNPEYQRLNGFTFQ